MRSILRRHVNDLVVGPLNILNSKRARIGAFLDITSLIESDGAIVVLLFLSIHNIRVAICHATQ